MKNSREGQVDTVLATRPAESVPINVVATGMMERERRASDDIAVT